MGLLKVLALFLIPAVVWGQQQYSSFPTNRVYSTLPAFRNGRSPYGNFMNPPPPPPTQQRPQSHPPNRPPPPHHPPTTDHHHHHHDHHHHHEHSPVSGNCRMTQTPNGGYKVTCDPRAAPTARSEHILWLSGPKGGQQILDIEIPNYKINELIKAGFKGTPVSNTQVNLLLRRPVQSVESQVQPIGFASGTPQVNLNYEPVQPKIVHFPVDQQYSPLRGPLVPPPPKYGASNFDIV